MARARESPPPTRRTSAAGMPRSRRVLLLVDVVNPLAFDGAEDLAGPALDAATAIARLKRHLAADGVPAIYANDHFGQWRDDMDALVAACRRRGGAPAALMRRIAPQRRDFVVLKPRYSAFDHTPLELLLQQIGARELVIVGFAADLCVQFTAADAFVRGFRLWVPRDCVAAESPQRCDTALQGMAQALGCRTQPAPGPDGASAPRRRPRATSGRAAAP